MSRSWKTTIFGLLAAAGAMVVAAMVAVAGMAAMAATAYGGEGPIRSVGRDLWATATIEPGREGIVEVGGYEGVPLGEGSVLTLTAPAQTRVTGTPFAAGGYRGAVTLGGISGTYTFVGAPAAAGSAADASAWAGWKGRTFPFVLAVPADAEPGTRLPDCALVLRDANGTVRQKGTCAVTVGLPAPVLSRPQSGVPLGALPKTSGTAYPGAQVTVRDAQEEEVCSTTAAPDGTWSCVPARALPSGAGRLQATATLNGVSAMSEQIDITVTGQ
ncbi:MULTISPECIES: carboxypeptidase regulatory-like domain-containing protein [unclassified Streptomyces]|uniref:carboxypeptidase regulatory-like domain-containing protein n=1 Tax=unclassified Streptomyces TaxID=2593676 RepID=UPI00236560D9|nr:MULTISPECIES: carboxypeptidase regulatory-like domain-containing protein [unclassified Streptomyces]MDF3142504.1 carboxypeptidase regulatory-like domain-containing protein [Streptomyces sp. T21Q-yed]WDF39766.1 carboxypeptidase regulatory-like domain-containing protein [Streptomyces sp. T12]